MQGTRGGTTNAGWLVWALRACLLMVVAAATTGWVAVDRSHDAALAVSRAPDASLTAAIALADSAAALAAQLQASVDGLTLGTGSSVEAVNFTVAISQNLRTVLAVVAGFDNLGVQGANQIEVVTNSLGDIEASLLEAEGGLGEANTALTTAQPLVEAAAADLRAIPDDLRAAQFDQSAAQQRLDDDVVFWRSAIVFTAVVLLVLVAAQLAVLTSRRNDRVFNQPS